MTATSMLAHEPKHFYISFQLKGCLNAAWRQQWSAALTGRVRLWSAGAHHATQTRFERRFVVSFSFSLIPFSAEHPRVTASTQAKLCWDAENTSMDQKHNSSRAFLEVSESPNTSARGKHTVAMEAVTREKEWRLTAHWHDIHSWRLKKGLNITGNVELGRPRWQRKHSGRKSVSMLVCNSIIYQFMEFLHLVFQLQCRKSY